ncbi:MAG: GIY-YIG nuclease family protein [Candidatus Parcubacteria bacterium]|nr:GIY-YIG nuclease family protein [Candidatus Parcubacteria bacterium]
MDNITPSESKGPEPRRRTVVDSLYFVYLILCKNKSIYTGVTNNPKRRFTEHSTGKGGAHTKKYPAVEILRTEEFKTKTEALKREKQIIKAGEERIK